MALLLHADLYLAFLLLQGIPLLQGLGHRHVALARLLEGLIGCGNAGGLLPEGFTGADFLLALLLALAGAALLEFQAVLLGRDGLLQRRLTLLQCGVFLGLG